MSFNPSPAAPAQVAVECQSLWKIFGAHADQAMAAIRAEGLAKSDVLSRFGCVVGVADATFRVAEGEIFCIMGLSGSGKSTLVRHINRLVEPTSGRVLVDGVDIGALDAVALRRVRAETIGMVFQNMALLPHRSVRDNVALGLELRGVKRQQRYEAADRALAMVHLSDWAGRNPRELSGGMQQRVGLARAIAADPKILLMDEPFSALDPLIRKQLQTQFLELASVMRKTTVFITHDLDEAIRLGHRIALMRDGRIVQIGTAQDIVLAPADAYVAEFVKDVSRLKVIRAHTVMRRLDAYLALHPRLSAADLAGFPSTHPDADLDALIALAVGTDKPTVILADGKPIGIVDKHDLLLGIRGGPEAGGGSNE